MKKLIQTVARKLFLRDEEELLIYRKPLPLSDGEIRVYILKNEIGKYKFEHKTKDESHSFKTRRYLTNKPAVEELQLGLYDKVLSKKFDMNISLIP